MAGRRHTTFSPEGDRPAEGHDIDFQAVLTSSQHGEPARGRIFLTLWHRGRGEPHCVSGIEGGVYPRSYEGVLRLGFICVPSPIWQGLPILLHILGSAAATRGPKSPSESTLLSHAGAMNQNYGHRLSRYGGPGPILPIPEQLGQVMCDGQQMQFGRKPGQPP